MKEEYFSFWDTKGRRLAFSVLRRYQFWLWGIGISLLLLLVLVILGTYFFYRKLIETIVLISWNPYLIGVTAILLILSVFEKDVRRIWGIKLGRINLLLFLGAVIWMIIHFGFINGFFYWVVVTILSALLKAFIKVSRR